MGPNDKLMKFVLDHHDYVDEIKISYSPEPGFFDDVKLELVKWVGVIPYHITHIFANDTFLSISDKEADLFFDAILNNMLEKLKRFVDDAKEDNE